MKQAVIEQKETEAYMLIALRRRSISKGENVDLKEKSIRLIVKGSYEESIERLRRMIKQEMEMEPSTWRIYRSVNKRSFPKALKLLQIDLILNGEAIQHRVADVWKKMLMSPKAKASRNFLIDIDTKDMHVKYDIKEHIVKMIRAKYPCCPKEYYTYFKEEVETPNGFHLVTEPFDTRGFDFEHFAEIKKDAILFVELIT